MKNNLMKAGTLNAGFTVMHAVMGVGLVAVIVLAFFGLPSGVKNFFAKFTGNSGGLASISSFGDFGTEETADLANLNIDEVAKTIYTDLTNVQAATKSEAEDVKNGVCFKNASGNDKDFYNIISDVHSDSACADGESIETVVSLPGTTVFTDPASNSNKSIVFIKNGTTTSAQDIIIKVSNSTGVRMIVVTPAGVITYTDKIPGTASGSVSKNTVSNNATFNTGEAARLASIAAGLSNVLNGIKSLQSQSASLPQNNLPGTPFLGASSINGQVHLSWSQPSAPASYPITFYKLYRGTYSNGEVLVSALGSNFNSYTDSGLAQGNYYYKISASNQNGEGAQSNEVVANVNSPIVNHSSSFAQSYAPGKPSLYLSLSSSNQPVLNWTIPSQGSSQIVAYRIFRGGSFIAETSGTNYIDYSAGANTYCYTVSARNSQAESSKSNRKCIATNGNGGVSNQVPGSPSLSGTAGNGQVTLNWSVPSIGSSSIIEYNIYRSYSSGATMTFISSTSSNSITLNGLSNGTAHYYKVRARNSQGEGRQSNELLIIPTAPNSGSNSQTGQTPDMPTNFSISSENGKVTLNWSAPNQGSSNIIEYLIYRAPTTQYPSYLTSTTQTTYIDSAVSVGQDYTYYVTARNMYGESRKQPMGFVTVR